MTPDDHRHGTHAGYQKHKRDNETPCTHCAAAFTRWRKDYEVRALKAGGTVKVAAAPIRAHLQTLNTRLTMQAIAAASGVSHHAVKETLTGKWDTVRASTAERILAVSPNHVPDGAHWINATGATRRLQALQAVGWSLQEISARLGTCRENSRVRMIATGKAERVTSDMYRRICDIYDDLWDVPPVAVTPHARAAVTATVRRAKGNGWAPPLAWDEDTIDDPAATPDVGDTPDRVNGGTGRRSTDVAEDVAFLLEHDPTLTSAQLADRLGYQGKSAIQHALDRAGLRDLLARLARNAEERAA